MTNSETLTLEQVAALLHVSIRGLYKLRSEGRCPPPAGRAGRRWLWLRADVAAWLQGGSHE